MSSKEQDESQIVNGFGARNYIGWTPDNWILEKSERSRYEGGCVVAQSYRLFSSDKEVIILPCLGFCVGAWRITEIKEITNTKEYIAIRLHFDCILNKEAK